MERMNKGEVHFHVQEIVFDKYCIQEVLKKNNRTVVYLAEHVSLKSQWIIKQLNKRSDSLSIDQEVKMLKALRFPGIPMIIDIIRDEGSIYLIREYIKGKTLSELVAEKGCLKEREVLNLGIGLCHILHYLHRVHEAPLIYRDLKPDNVVMTPDKRPYLIDFGIARYYDKDRDQDTTYLGTKGFAAPEQFGLTQSDVRTDIFGLGATLHYALTQTDLLQPPYRFEPVRKYRKDISLELEQIISRCTKMKKENRFQTVEALRYELDIIEGAKNNQGIGSLLQHQAIKTICVKGLKHGAGATYLSLKLCQLLRKKHRLKAYVVDCSSMETLNGFMYQKDTSQEEQVLINEEVFIIGVKGLGDFLYQHKKDLETAIFIFDQGAELTKTMIRDVVFDMEVVVCGLNPWETEIFEDFALSKDVHKQQIVMNHISKNVFEKLKDSIHGLNLYHLIHQSYESDIGEYNEKALHQLLEEGGIELCLEKERKIPFSQVGNYITNLQKRIKQLLSV
jgi:serine/threonine-protein kinase